HNEAVRPEFITVKIDATGRPWVAYKRTNRPGQNDYQCVVYKLNDAYSGWDLVGGTKASEGTSSSTKADSIQLTIDNSGTPYVFYSDYSNSRNGKGTVRRYNGSNWETVGSAGFTTGAISMSSIAVDRLTNDIYIAYADKGAGDNLYVKKWTGSS